MDARKYDSLPEGTRVEVKSRNTGEYRPGKVVKAWGRTSKKVYQYSRVILDGENRSKDFHSCLVRLAEGAA